MAKKSQPAVQPANPNQAPTEQAPPAGFDPNQPLPPTAVASGPENTAEPTSDQQCGGNDEFPTQKTSANDAAVQPVGPFRFGDIVPPSMILAAAQSLADGESSLPPGANAKIAFINGNERVFYLPPPVDLTDQERTGYASAHVNVQLRGAEAYEMKRFVKTLQAANVRLDSGEGPHVRSAADAVRWLVQKLSQSGF